jgi:hypothetical protein
MSAPVSNHAKSPAHLTDMRTSIVAVVVGVWATACGGAETGTNPSTLWLAMDLGQTQMVLVGEEPHPY